MSCSQAEVLTAALNQEQQVEEARKVEEKRKQQEEYQAMLARLEAEAHQRTEEDRQKKINEALARMERERERDLQVRLQAITAMQGGGVPGPLMVGAALAVRACERCTVLLKDPEGCVLSEKGKAQSCVLCQKACKTCNWPPGQTGATTATGSGTEGSGKAAPKRVMRRRPRTMTNTSPRSGEKCKKARTTMEEGEEEDEDVEMFGVPKAMAEEQRDVLGMLTQTLSELSERLAASEACEFERLAIERERLVLEWRRLAWEEERLELERARMEIEQQRAEDIWRMGRFVRAPFVQESSTGTTRKELEMAKEMEGKGEEVDNEDEDAQGDNEE